MKVNPDIFKHYDIRGKVGTELTTNVTYEVGRVLADWLSKDGPVAVGYDMRPDSKELAASLIQGLAEQGRDVWDVGQIATDMIYFAVGQYKLSGGAVVTASHNPGADNGIKMVAEEAKPIGLDTGLDKIRDMILSDSVKKSGQARGKIITKDITEGWISHVLSFVDVQQLKPLKIAVDAGNGMAGKIFPKLEPHLPFSVTEMYFELDGTFPNHEANPLKFETLVDISKKIKENQLDGGIAFDGDGDRAFLLDENGEILTGAVMSSMITEYFLEKYPGATIVYDVRNSRSVPELIKELGGKPVICRVGHAPLKQKMRDVDAMFGGEASGHFYFKDNWYADSGLIGALVGLYVQSLSGKKLSELKKVLTRYNAIPETNFVVTNKDRVLRNVEEKYKTEKIEKIDGVTISFTDDSWFNLRPSNTESLIRLNVEAKSPERLNELVEELKVLIK